MTTRVPIAWLQLANAKIRLLAATAGVAFTIVFSLVQLGLQDGLYRSVTQLYSHLRTDLVLISPRYQCIVSPENFPERRLYQALAVPGVQSVAALYFGLMPWKNPQDHRSRQIFAIGFKPSRTVFDFPGINEHLSELAQPVNIAFDAGSRREFGPVPRLLAGSGPVATELAFRRVHVVALFEAGANFATDGSIITSDTNFFRLSPPRQPGIAELGLIQLTPGIDSVAARNRVAQALPNDVEVLTLERLLEREKAFFGSSLPVGFFFQISVLAGLLVGAVIVYQILYSDVSQHLSEYATVKAMGYRNRYLVGLVLRQAFLLSLLGLPAGVAISFLAYRIIRSATLLPMRMDLLQVTEVYLLTLAMCSLAGVLALAKLRQADPVDVF